jgi:formate/nitrite transporter FocA (FNT family)
MNGVEILNQTTIYETDVYLWIFWVIVSAGFLISLGVAIYNWAQYGFDGVFIAVIFLVTLLCFWIGLLGVVLSAHDTDTVDHIEYQVTVSDDVNFNEFSAKYEILGQEGRIYTVKERE